ncbi:protein of unknown function [Streptococcus thermophilus]|nr:protein of unknown function [Streptococcus thermophilus]CAD0151000.1 protein of unknown function [Streptococcus thermophilus]
MHNCTLKKNLFYNSSPLTIIIFKVLLLLLSLEILYCLIFFPCIYFHP